MQEESKMEIKDIYAKEIKEAENLKAVYGILNNGMFHVLRPKGGYDTSKYGFGGLWREFELSSDTISLKGLELLCSLRIERNDPSYEGFSFRNFSGGYELEVLGSDFPEKYAKIFGATHLGFIEGSQELSYSFPLVQYYRLKSQGER